MLAPVFSETMLASCEAGLAQALLPASGSAADSIVARPEDHQPFGLEERNLTEVVALDVAETRCVRTCCSDDTGIEVGVVHVEDGCVAACSKTALQLGERPLQDKGEGALGVRGLGALVVGVFAASPSDVERFRNGEETATCRKILLMSSNLIRGPAGFTEIELVGTSCNEMDRL